VAAGFAPAAAGRWAFAGEPPALNAALDRARAAGALLLELSQEGKDLEAVLAEAMRGEVAA
jgi:ABC-2 type transport system ATP-binding protein